MRCYKKNHNLKGITGKIKFEIRGYSYQRKNDQFELNKKKVLEYIEVVKSLDDSSIKRVFLKGTEALQTYQDYLYLFKDYLYEDEFFIHYQESNEVFFTVKDIDIMELLDKMINNAVTAYVIGFGKYYIKTKTIGVYTSHIDYLLSIYINIMNLYLPYYFELKAAHICYAASKVSKKVYHYLIDNLNTTFFESLIDEGFYCDLDNKYVAKKFSNLKILVDNIEFESLNKVTYRLGRIFAEGEELYASNEK
ncbi:MAG TPA: hypothetical protein GX708_18540 [Gallicola sp.]|nr:hypothetical protein [Gallicola sp.]